MESNPQEEQKSILPDWLKWAREIQAISQTGLHFAENHYQEERFSRLLEISVEIISTHSNLDRSDLIEGFNQQFGYATPRVDVRGAVFRDQCLLFVREIEDGGWTMPGGWVDVGDTPSGAVEREVYEESGIKIKNIQYITSQPWPFPHSLMMGYIAEYESGEIQIDPKELCSAAWYDADNLPALPNSGTLARKLIDKFKKKCHSLPFMRQVIRK